MTTTVPTAGDEERLVERLRAACVGHPAAEIPWPHRLLHEAADLITRLRQERDEAQSMVQAWDHVFGTIEAHIMDRVNMGDPASPELYLQIIRSDVANIKRNSDQICAARWADYGRHEAALSASNAEAERLRARQKAIETLLYTDECFYGTDWHGKHYTDATADPTPVLCVNFINYGADAEPIPEEWIIPLAALVEKHGGMAVHAWVCAVRGLDDLPKGKLNADCRAVLDEVRAALQGSAKQ